jgi:hypothetical protein
MISYGLIVDITGLKDWEDKHILDLGFVAHERFLLNIRGTLMKENI